MPIHEGYRGWLSFVFKVVFFLYSISFLELVAVPQALWKNAVVIALVEYPWVFLCQVAAVEAYLFGSVLFFWPYWRGTQAGSLSDLALSAT